jgi:hypothetical protein
MSDNTTVSPLRQRMIEDMAARTSATASTQAFFKRLSQNAEFESVPRARMRGYARSG